MRGSSSKEGEKQALRSLVDRALRGELSRRDALRELAPDFPRLTEFSFDIDPEDARTARLVPAAPGAATGELTFSAAAALERAAAGAAVILAVQETFPEDIEAMRASRGVLAVGGGLTGHAAIVARGLGRPCVCSGSAIRLTAAPSGPALRIETARGEVFERRAGERVWFDGRTGLLVVEPPTLLVSDEVAELARWALDAAGDARTLAEAFHDRAPADLFEDARSG